MFTLTWNTQPKNFDSLTSMYHDDTSFIELSSIDDEGYICAIPHVSSVLKSDRPLYTGPSPGDLIKHLSDERICSYWLDLYWSYELCHGRYVLQFHDAKDLARSLRSEYYLGNFQRESSKLDDKSFDHSNPPIRKIDSRNIAYYPVTYRQGTICDITGKPRQTTVMYVCKEDAKDQIYSITEITSCTYEMVVLTSKLCSHPLYKSYTPGFNEITCYAINSNQNEAVPQSLSAVKKESEDRGAKEYSLVHQNLHEHNEVSLTVDDYRKSMEYFSQNLGPDNAFEIPDRTKRSKISTINSELDAHRSWQLLSGEQCLYSDQSSWWIYEFCYGKSVLQFHDFESGRSEILLGVFNEEIHRVWIEENPKKEPVKIDGKILQVTHFYTGGDACEGTNNARSVEVRIRCRDSGDSRNAGTLYLIEAKTCQYILSVESSIFCPLLQEADEFGLLKIPKKYAQH